MRTFTEHHIDHMGAHRERDDAQRLSVQPLHLDDSEGPLVGWELERDLNSVELIKTPHNREISKRGRDGTRTHVNALCRRARSRSATLPRRRVYYVANYALGRGRTIIMK